MVKIVINQQRVQNLTVDQVCALEDMSFGEQLRMRELRDLFGAFVVDENGEYLGSDAGRKAIGHLTITELQDVAEQFKTALQDAFLPQQSGGS